MSVFSGTTALYVGTTSYSKAYVGDVQVWPSIVAPAWPKNYFYPNVDGYSMYNGISFWKDNLISGQTYNISVHRSDDEGEGGGGYTTILTSAGTVWSSGYQSNDEPSRIIPINNYQNAWVNIYDGWTMRFNSFGDFDGGTAIAYRSRETYGGNGTSIALTGINWNNIELAINLVDHSEPNYDRFGGIVNRCTNLKYIALNKNGINTGQTYTLTGSTAWTADSMKFTEWYCPGTTFIIENNSWWRSRIDWDIADQRNITFKDTNGNIIHR